MCSIPARRAAVRIPISSIEDRAAGGARVLAATVC
jgi:hypothetical protein